MLAIVAADREGLAAGRRLRVHHLRGSSALAYEADIVLMINDKYDVVARHHLVYDVGNAERFRNFAVMSIEKNRSGLDRIDLEFRKRFEQGRFETEGRVSPSSCSTTASSSSRRHPAAGGAAPLCCVESEPVVDAVGRGAVVLVADVPEEPSQLSRVEGGGEDAGRGLGEPGQAEQVALAEGRLVVAGDQQDAGDGPHRRGHEVLVGRERCARQGRRATSVRSMMTPLWRLAMVVTSHESAERT